MKEKTIEEQLKEMRIKKDDPEVLNKEKTIKEQLRDMRISEDKIYNRLVNAYENKLPKVRRWGSVVKYFEDMREYKGKQERLDERIKRGIYSSGILSTPEAEKLDEKIKRRN